MPRSFAVEVNQNVQEIAARIMGVENQALNARANVDSPPFRAFLDEFRGELVGLRKKLEDAMAKELPHLIRKDEENEARAKGLMGQLVDRGVYGQAAVENPARYQGKSPA